MVKKGGEEIAQIQQEHRSIKIQKQNKQKTNNGDVNPAVTATM